MFSILIVVYLLHPLIKQFVLSVKQVFEKDMEFDRDILGILDQYLAINSHFGKLLKKPK